jgi:uncharacterized membrane protein
MSHLIALTFDDDTTAFEMRSALLKMQKQDLIDLEDSVVVVRDLKGKVKLDQTSRLTLAGLIGGGLWGMLIGLFVLSPLVGASIGSKVGLLGARFIDIGVDDRMVRDVGAGLKPGTAALFILVRHVAAEPVLARLHPFTSRGKLFQTSLSDDDEATLREAFEQTA